MILNQPCCDWLTMTTFETRQSVELHRLVRETCGGSHKESTIRGYVGREWANGFWGEGEQRGQRHFMCNLWGQQADDALRVIVGNIGQCKRIDLQITIPMPVDYDAIKLDESLRDEAISWGGRRKNINTIKGHPKGMDTVYIGSWHSDVFARVYVKCIDGEKYLRYEQVYKGDVAQPVYDRVAMWSTPEIGRVLHNEILILPDVPHLRRFREILLGYEVGRLVRGERVRDEDNTLTWIMRQVIPTVRRVGNEKERGRPVRELVRNLCKEFDKIDEGQ